MPIALPLLKYRRLKMLKCIYVAPWDRQIITCVLFLLQRAVPGSSIVRKVTAFLRHGHVTTLSTAKTPMMNDIAVSQLIRHSTYLSLLCLIYSLLSLSVLIPFLFIYFLLTAPVFTLPHFINSHLYLGYRPLWGFIFLWKTSLLQALYFTVRVLFVYLRIFIILLLHVVAYYYTFDCIGQEYFEKLFIFWQSS